MPGPLAAVAFIAAGLATQMPSPAHAAEINVPTAGAYKQVVLEDAAQALIKAFGGPSAAAVLKSKGMEPPG
jgi:hypothetical protein